MNKDFIEVTVKGTGGLFDLEVSYPQLKRVGFEKSKLTLTGKF